MSDDFLMKHPEIAQAKEQISQKAEAAHIKASLAGAITGTAALVALTASEKTSVVRSLTRNNHPVVLRIVRTATTLIGAIGGNFAGLYVFTPKPKEYVELRAKYDRAVAEDLKDATTKGEVKNPISGEPVNKEFVTTVTPREESHIAQATKDAAQPSTPAIGAK